MEYPKFSFRIAPEIATRLEEEATNCELSTSGLVREIVTTHYGMSAASETSNGETIASEADAERRFQQLIFEIVKTHSAVLRIGLQTISEETMERAGGALQTVSERRPAATSAPAQIVSRLIHTLRKIASPTYSYMRIATNPITASIALVWSKTTATA